jgi:hypothetical protein
VEDEVEQLNRLSDLDIVLEQAPVQGIMTMVWVQERSDTDVGVAGITYPKTRIMALMGRSTAEKILASPRYQQAISECRQGDRRAFMCRYIIAVVDKQRPMFVFAIQEPKNSVPYVEYLRNTDVVAGFDPLASGPDFALQSTREDGGFNPRILILGGYVGRGQFSMLQECYAEAVAPTPAWLFFGKVIEPAFCRDVVKNDLSQNAEEANANWDDYNAWKSSSPANIFIDGKADWDCGARIPANLAGRSWKLRLHGAGVARVDRKVALNDSTPVRHFAFDLMSHCEAEARHMEPAHDPEPYQHAPIPPSAYIQV